MQAQDMRLIPVSQRFDSTHIADIPVAVKAAVESCHPDIRPGMRIALGVGSRGVANIAQIAKALVACLRSLGADPFIFPAMGSHGGATPEGQREVLAGYGVTEDTVGAPIVSSLSVVSLEAPHLPVKVYASRDAWEADGIVLINRVKPHTDFHGPVESGLMKMSVIGLGKHAQALEIHRFGVLGLREYIPLVARQVLASGKVLMGVGVVENAYDQTMVIRAARGVDIPALDAELLALARRHMPSLPMDALDVLLVDKLGKDISGTGLDTNIIGRMRIPGQPEPEGPNIAAIVCDSVSPGSHGNGVGVGLCEAITRKLFNAIDFQATYENVITSAFLERARVPVTAEHARQAVDWALRSIGPRIAEKLLAARIVSTLKVDELLVSQASLDRLRAGGQWEARGMSVLGQPLCPFDAQGELVSWPL